jgi:hypothetical protein
MTADLIATDYITPEYQWQKSIDNGVTWNNIPGTDSSSYTSYNPAYGDEFRFIVAETVPNLSNPNCSVPSNPVSITTTAGITGTTPGSVCGTGTVILGATANSGSTINWYANLTGGSSLGTGTSFTTPTISSTTTYYVEATNGGCTSNPRTSVVATVNTSVVASISISANTGSSICSGTNVTFTATPTNGGATPSYQWKLNGVNVGTNSPTYSNNTLANGDMISCVMTSSISGCITGSPATSNTITMTVGSTVAASVSISANPGNTICQGTSVTFTAVPTNGGATPDYQWQNNSTNIYGAVSNIYTTSSLVQGDVITCVMTTSLTCATGSPATSNGIIMTVNALPVALVLTGSTICTSPGGTGTITSTTSVSGVNYQLYTSGAVAVQTAKAGTNSITVTWSSLAAGTGYYVKGTNATTSCVSPSSNAVNVATYANPVATASSNSPRCVGTTLTLTGGPGSMTTYSWTGPNSFTSSNQSPSITSVTTAAAGLYTLVVTDGNGCTSSATTTVVVNTNPVATASSNSPRCVGTTLTLTGGPGSMTT